MRSLLRTLPLLAGAAYLGLSIAWLSTDRTVDRSAFDADSSLNTGLDGASLAYEYLRRTGRTVVRRDRPLAEGGLPDDAVVLQLGAGEEPNPFSGPPRSDDDEGGPPLLAEPVWRWVAGGGRIVIAVRAPLGPINSPVDAGEGKGLRSPGRAEQAAGPVVRVHPTWPGVDAIEPANGRFLSGPPLDEGHSILARGERPVAARIDRGRGEVVLLSMPEVLRNERLGRADHLALLEALVGDRSTVVFDETIHGLVDELTPVDLLSEWGLGPLLVLGACLVAVGWWRRARRLGEPDHDAADQRSEAVDLVDSLAVLYEQALTRPQALVLFREHLSHAVAVKTGLKGEALEKRVVALCPVPSRKPRGRAAFRRDLDRINKAFNELEHVERR